jgi:hypothetical protein
MDSFITARDVAMRDLADRIQRQFERSLINDIAGIFNGERPTPDCPSNIGNDPCDDWDDYENEDY